MNQEKKGGALNARLTHLDFNLQKMRELKVLR